MNKEQLVNLGLSEELAGKVVAELEGKYIPKSRFNEVNEELKKQKEIVKERDLQLENLKKAETASKELQTQIENLQKENKQKDDDYNKQLNQFKLDTAIDKALGEAKAKNIKAVKALLELGDIKMGSDGSLKGLAEQLTKLTQAENTKFLFDAVNETKGFVPANKSNSIPGDAGAYQAKLQEARKIGDTIAAIKIKQEAHANGVVLI